LPFIGNTETATSTSAVFGYIFGYTSTSSSVAGTINQGSSTSYKYYVPTTIKSVTITKQTVILDYAFHNCTLIGTINIPNGTTEIGDYAFTQCYALTTVVIPKDSLLTVIDRFAFYDCGELTSIYLPSKLTTIGDYAFRHCVKLATVYDASTALNIYAGSESNGYVGKYATNVVYVTE
jgi:hypothetical protein